MNPLGHITMAHKLPSNELKDRLLLGHTSNTFFSTENSEKQSNNAKKQNLKPHTYNPVKKHTELAKEKIRFAIAKSVLRISPGEIRLYGCITDAANENGVSHGALRSCLRGDTKRSGGYHWQFYDSDKTIGEILASCPTGEQKNFGAKKPVIRISDTGEETVYSGINEAARQNGITSSAISACLRGLSKISAGYRWKYLKEE